MLTAEKEILNKTKQDNLSVDSNNEVITGLQDEQSNRLFPIFLKLENLNTLIIGGGAVGLEKLSAVLNNSPKANVTLVAPSIKEEIILLAEKYPNVRLIQRAFDNRDFDNKDIVISATNDRKLNSLIREEAKKRKILINVADTPELCDFYLSSVVKKGSVKLAISTNGKSPTIAKRFKEILNDAVPDEMENVLDNLVKIRGRLNGNFSEKVKTLNKITSALIDNPKKKITLPTAGITRYLLIALGILLTMIAGHLIFQSISFDFLKRTIGELFLSADNRLPWFILAGFIAQMIDGALGMAYGVSATTFLLALGIPPVAVSASVHTSEIFTSGASGLFHLKFGNVNIRLFKNLLLPGILGAIAGAYVLSYLSEYNTLIKLLIAFYTLILGTVIIFKVFKKKNQTSTIKNVIPLAGLGGFFDSVGGGGWGPIVSSTLIAKGKHPLITIGSVNLAEFFVALASSAAFITLIGLVHWQIILGLVVGGIFAAPFAAKLTGKLPVRTMMILIGALIILLSLKIIFTIIF
jgi:hypothetical protein